MKTLRYLAFLTVLCAALAGCAGRSVRQVSSVPDIQKIGNATASVKKIAERQYQISRVTVYGPAVYTFTVTDDGAVSSEELGAGTVSYRSDLKLTTIRFEKTNFLCELSR